MEYTARSLCAEYVGQTAARTAAVCRDSYGSVLFIDEAYALYENDTQTNDYGKEALTTLISEMENAFGIQFAIKDIHAMKTVGEMADRILELQHR